MSLYTLGYTGAEVDEAVRRAYEVFSRKNLLHNWDFRNPVNQRGQSSYTVGSSTPVIDRWKMANGTITVATMTLTATNTYGAGLSQYIENPSRYDGMTVTFSVDLTVSGADAYARFVVNGSAYYSETIPNGFTGIFDSTVTLPTGMTSLVVQWYGTLSTVTVTKRAKLEVGSVSTLANDAPADFGSQLALCQRFALSIPASTYRAVSYTANTITFVIPTPVTLRVDPLFSVAPAVQTVGGSAQTGFTFAYTAMSNGIKVVATKTSHALTDATLAVSACIVSADL